MPTAFGIAFCAVRARILRRLPAMTDQEWETLAADPVFVRKVAPIIRWLIRVEMASTNMPEGSNHAAQKG